MEKTQKPILLSVQKIWSEGLHHAFTDLIRFNEIWYCVFRDGVKHVGKGEGTIRILQSKDGVGWQSVASLAVEGVDLRDPKLSVTPNGRLMLLVGGTQHNKEDKYLSRQPMVAFSSDGTHWTPFEKILGSHDWLWRVTWHKGIVYGVSYRYSNPAARREEWETLLYESYDGLNWNFVTKFEIPGYPNETTLRVQSNDEMVALVRRNKRGDNVAWLGYSTPPYVSWDWYPTNHYYGGPNFIILPNQELWASGRLISPTPYGYFEKTVLSKIEDNRLKTQLILPSGGFDCSYPGMVYHDNTLWVSYYSSHEISFGIYVARVYI